jgi:hypothetical protein
MFTGNRGCLVDDDGQVVRHHRGDLWIICVLVHRDWRHPLDAPRTWTPIFFLDDAVALAAGHRPCGLCRRPDYLAYREAVPRTRDGPAPDAAELNRRLARERLKGGRGVERADDRITWAGDIESLPNGTVIVDGDKGPRLVMDDRLFAFTFSGWTNPRARPDTGNAHVLTPPTSVAALSNGFQPVLHPSATG